MLKKFKIILFIFFFGTYFVAHGQSEYHSAYIKLNFYLKKDSVKFKEVVFAVENAFDSRLLYEPFNTSIQFWANLARLRNYSDSLNYLGKDKAIVKTFAAIFRTLSDTTIVIANPKNLVILPFHYDFEDIFGGKRWENMFVTKLLATRKGNCHSMPRICTKFFVKNWVFPVI